MAFRLSIRLKAMSIYKPILLNQSIGRMMVASQPEKRPLTAPSASLKTPRAQPQNTGENIHEACAQYERTGACGHGSKCKFAHSEGKRSQKKDSDAAAATMRPSKKRNRSERKKKASGGDPRLHFKAFFARYPDFDYNPSLPVMEEYYRMCDTLWPGKNKEDPERAKAYEGIRDALVQQFNEIYGTNKRSLVAWQKLCVVLELKNIPNNLEACREARFVQLHMGFISRSPTCLQLVESTNVNLVDLVDIPITQAPVRHFYSEQALSTYTQETGKYFPRENAHAGGLLRFLLRRIFNPGKGSTRSTKRANRQ